MTDLLIKSLALETLQGLFFNIGSKDVARRYRLSLFTLFNYYVHRGIMATITHMLMSSS